jgi:hypothetical protein
MTQKPDEHEPSDEMIPGSGHFVESVLLNGDKCRVAGSIGCMRPVKSSIFAIEQTS